MLAASFAKACRESDVGTVLLWLFEDSTLREVINSKDETGKTALHHTCRNGNIKLLTLLLLNGADIVERDDDGHTALFDAFETGHISRILDTILALVLERRTCFSIGTFQAVVSEILNLPTIAFSLKEKYQFLLKSNNFTNSSNLRGKSLLHIAWDKNDLDMVEYLLSIGADSTGVDEYGNQALPKGESHIYHKYTLPDGADPVVHQVTFNEDGFQGGWLTGSKAYLDYIFLHFAQLSTLVLINIDMFQHNMSQGPGTYPNCEVFISVNCNLHFLPVMPKLQKLSLYTTKFNDKYSKTHMHDTEWSNLQSLIIRNTFINNIKKWNFLKLTKFVMSGSKHSLLPESLEKCEMLDELVVTNNRLAQLPQNLPSTLKILDCSYNRLETLPVPIAHLKQLSVFEFKGNQNLILPPISLSRNSLKQKLCYLQKFLEEKDENNLVKVVLIGEEGVGKSTLLTSLSRQGLQLSQGCLPDKTDGIDIKELSHQDIQFKFFDFAGDKEFLETHMLFVSEYTIYLCVYDMSRFALQTDNPLGRLELWLENIFIKCPNSVCILIGTHCDSDVVCNELKSMITTKLEKWFDKVRNTHKEKFQENGIEDCLLGCFLENVDANQNFKVKQRETLCVPHILDHVQVNCLDGLRIKLRDDKRMKDLWMKLCNAGNHILKNDAVRRIPKKWKELKEILMAMETPKIDLETVFDKGSRVGCPEDECVSMLKFFHAIGDIVFYEDLDGLVVLHPEWLANQLKKVVTYQNHDLVQEGRITLKKARESWTYMDENEQLQLLCLFENMGLSVKMPDNSYLFPCLLPLGQPCERRWPIYPEENERQLSYLIQFNFIPITFFSRLIIRIETEKDRLVRTWEPEYYASTILFDYKGRPNWCEVHTTEYEAIQKKMDLYRVRIKLNSRKRTLHVTVRGATPCCTFQHVKKAIDDIKDVFYPELQMNTQVLCPKCILSGDKVPVSESSDEPLCLKGHNLNSKYDIQSGQTGTSQTSYNQNIQLISQLDDKECPRYFVLLPLNDESLGFINRLVNTVLFKDGYAIHFLCESPESLHFTGREGYKLEKPKPLFEKYGPYLYHILAVLSKALPHGGMVLQHGGGPEAFAVGQGMKIAAEGLSSAMDAFRNALEDNMKRYPEISRVVADLKTPRKVDRPIRRELCAFLNLNGKGDDFGGLYPVLHDGKYLWLCRGCYDKFEQKEDQLNLQ